MAIGFEPPPPAPRLCVYDLRLSIRPCVYDFRPLSAIRYFTGLSNDDLADLVRHDCHLTEFRPVRLVTGDEVGVCAVNRVGDAEELT
jgi:hypothetical protein